MIQGKFFSGNDDLTEIRKIRKAVFCEELGIEEEMEEDGQDALCMHVLAYDNGVPVAVGRIFYDGWEFIISKVAVLKAHRHKMYGDFIVRMLIDKAMMSGAIEIKLESPESCTAFFKSIGFEEKSTAVNQRGRNAEDSEHIQKSENAERRDSADEANIEMVLNIANIHKCCDCNH